jgi:D-amino-acid dehydrogenase
MNPVTSRSDQQNRDVTVIGAGIVGMSCALYLQRAGFDVTVVDRDAPGTGASSGNAGVLATVNTVPLGTPAIWRGVPRMLLDPASPLSIRWSYLPRLMPWALQLARASRPSQVERISSNLSSILERVHDAYRPLVESAGAEHLLRRQGWLHLFETPEAFASAQYDIGIRRTCSVRMEVLAGSAIREFEPGLQRDFHRAVYYPDPAHTVDPLALVRSFAERFAADGGTLETSEIRRIDISAGQPLLIRADGSTFRSQKVVIAAGAWSRQLAAMAGSRVPLDTERGYHVMLPRSGIDLSHPLVLYDRKFAITPMAGGLRLAGTVEFAGLAAPANPVRPRAMIEQVRKIFPKLDAEGATDWLGFRPSMPDSLPVIGSAAGSGSVLLAFGHGHLGLTLGPITGRIIADLALGKAPEIDVTPFRANRFG